MPQTNRPTSTPKGRATRERFAKAVAFQALSDQKLNLTQAAIDAGMSKNGAAVAGSRLFRDTYVQEKLRRVMGPDDIIRRLESIAKGKKPSKVVIEDGETVGKDGEAVPVQKKRREYDRYKGLDALSKIQGLVKEGNQGQTNQVQVNVLSLVGALPQDKLDDLIAQYTEGAE